MNKLKIGDEIQHRNGSAYKVVKLPDENDLLEECGLPFYGYKGEDSKIWNRRFDEMYDGRFKLIEGGTQ